MYIPFEPVNDEKEFKRILKVLGYPVVENLDKYRSIKYNDVERYEQINREANTIELIDKKDWNEPYKEKLKDLYYSLRNKGHEFNMHGVERFYLRVNKGQFTEEEAMEVLSKEFNKTQIEDQRPVKYYNGLQAVYTKDEKEVHNIINREKWEREKEVLKDYEPNNR